MSFTVALHPGTAMRTVTRTAKNPTYHLRVGGETHEQGRLVEETGLDPRTPYLNAYGFWLVFRLISDFLHLASFVALPSTVVHHSFRDRHPIFLLSHIFLCRHGSHHFLFTCTIIRTLCSLYPLCPLLIFEVRLFQSTVAY